MNDLARLAGLHVTHLYDVIAGRKVATKATRGKIRFAVSRILLRQAGSDLNHAAAYRMALALAAVILEQDPLEAQIADPQGSNFTAQWRGAADCRRLAQYLLNTGLGYTQADVARVAGVTKQAVSKALREIESRRDEKDFDAKVVKLESWILGM